MISPIESLAFSMHANPGVYAVLAGSGLSRAAKIPTGWEITLDLVRKLAALRGEHCDPDPEQWYRNTFAKEPDYSDLLDAVCKTPAERQQLLQSYVEPSDEDRDEGAKQPTTAHRAIAALAAQGFIRVIVTTNFDRLFETALEAATLTPVVVSTPDQLRGALPLIHTNCYLVKLHGDYLDSRILNTQDELEAYDEEFDRLLDRIFDEFGLVVCGWSAAWDGALRKALFRAPSRLFTTYWATRDQLGDEARRLVQHRRAELIRITDADEFFHTIQQHVESLQEFARPHPLSTEAAVASLKRYLAESRHRIPLSDLVDHVVESVFAATRDEAQEETPHILNRAAISEKMDHTEAASSTLLALGVTAGYWSEEDRWEQIDPWKRALERLGATTWPAGENKADLRIYAAILLLRALSVGALRARRLRLLGQLLETTIPTENGTRELKAILVLEPEDVAQGLPDIHSMLASRFRDCIRPHARRIAPDGTRHDLLFDRVEMLLALAHAHTYERTPHFTNNRFFYRDRIWYFQNNGKRILNEIDGSLSTESSNSPFVKAGIFGDTAEECRQAMSTIQSSMGMWT